MSAAHLADAEVGPWRVSTVDLWSHLLKAINPTELADFLPARYETMVFPLGSFDDYLCWRYQTEEEARRGHAWVVSELQAGKQPREIRREEVDATGFREHGGGAAPPAAGGGSVGRDGAD